MKLVIKKQRFGCTSFYWGDADELFDKYSKLNAFLTKLGFDLDSYLQESGYTLYINPQVIEIANADFDEIKFATAELMSWETNFDWEIL